MVETYDDGKRREFTKFGLRHRLGDLPAVELHNDDGDLVYLAYYEGGRLHRSHRKGPAECKWHPGGVPWLVSYYRNNHLHRPVEEGPANEVYDLSGNVLRSEFWVRGKKVQPPDALPKTKSAQKQ